MIMIKVNHPENPATEAQLSCPIALLGSPSPQLTNWQQVENDHDEDGDDMENVTDMTDISV